MDVMPNSVSPNWFTVSYLNPIATFRSGNGRAPTPGVGDEITWRVRRDGDTCHMTSAYDASLSGMPVRVKRLFTAKVDSRSEIVAGLSTGIITSRNGCTKSELLQAVAWGRIPNYMAGLCKGVLAEDRIAAVFSVGVGTMMIGDSVTILDPAFLPTDIELVVQAERDIAVIAARYAVEVVS